MNIEQFAEFKANPTTVEITKILTDLRDIWKENLANGSTLCTEVGETALLTARIVGKIEGLDEFLELEYPKEETSIEGEEE